LQIELIAITPTKSEVGSTRAPTAGGGWSVAIATPPVPTEDYIESPWTAKVADGPDLMFYTTDSK